VLMLWAVRIEARGYGTSGTIVLASLGIGVLGLVGSLFSAVTSVGQRPDPTPPNDS
jgi:hypothetical protein